MYKTKELFVEFNGTGEDNNENNIDMYKQTYIEG
jgi:hypothetical protein